LDRINLNTMKRLHTISDTEIIVAANHSKRTFTLRKNGSKYRTDPMSKQEFNSALNWTGNDWVQFFKTDGYYTLN
jgi:hypothetical protein